MVDKAFCGGEAWVHQTQPGVSGPEWAYGDSQGWQPWELDITTAPATTGRPEHPHGREFPNTP